MTRGTAVDCAAAPLLSVDGLRVTLDGHAVLSGVQLELRAGELLGVVGPNGAGKTTLLRAVTAVVRADGGRIAIGGRPLASIARGELARTVAVVQQLPQAPPTMRVADLVLLGRHPHLGLLGRESAQDRAVAHEAMRLAGCVRFAERALGTLSGGERRRAFIARGLAQQPALLLLDEPTANLDPQAQGEIFTLLRELVAAGLGVLVVLHDLTLAAAYCHRLALLDGGRVVAAGAPAAVLSAERVERVYGRHVDVIRHPRTGAPVIVPAAPPPADNGGRA